MFRDRSQWVIVGGGAVGIMLLAFVMAFGQPQGGAHGNGSNGGPPGGNGGPSGDGSHGHYNGGDNGRDNRWPGYQRHAGKWKNRGGDWRRDGYPGRPWMTPQVSSSWFQRPYPYHLDYYKMRWGGSYAPYFGNLYGVPFGTPQVVNGGWGPGPGGWGPDSGAAPPPGYEWMDSEPGSGGTVANSSSAIEKTQTDANSSNTRADSQSTGSESLPTPSK